MSTEAAAFKLTDVLKSSNQKMHVEEYSVILQKLFTV
jgi:hypothetical protein